ncbi:MAG: glucose-6-phosphate dehydrogenase assembly protein OpcA [Gemmataceae bacterium]
MLANFLVPLRDVERELNKHMKALQGAGSAPLQRARMSNLVIFCNSLESSIAVHEQVTNITAVHPTRTILLVGEPGPDRELTSRVTVRPVGTGKQHVCVEMVTLHAGGGFVDRLPFAVRSLLIGDLPINVWWDAPIPPPFAGGLLHELGDTAQQIIYDSVGWPEPARGVSATASWLEQMERPGGQWRVASDLNWRRLKHWRRLLTQALDESSAPGAIEAIREIDIDHGPHTVVRAWMLASWLTRRLGWRVQNGIVSPGFEMSWRFLTPRGEARVRIRRIESDPPSIRRVRFETVLDGRPVTVDVTPEGEETRRLVMKVEGADVAPRTITVPPHNAVDLIGRQLSDRERDPAFRESMAVAQVMARSIHA